MQVPLWQTAPPALAPGADKRGECTDASQLPATGSVSYHDIEANQAQDNVVCFIHVTTANGA
eukprot:scaffold155597_cov17-Tisochrysis_lutea.AAC.1